jgi:predicted permease
VRFAFRMLRKNPGFTLAAVLCLMLGIGATTGIFSVVNAVLLRPLPYAHPDQLVRVYTEFPNFPNGGLRRFWSSPPEFLDLRRDAHLWQTLDAWATSFSNVAGQTQPVRLNTAFVSGTLLESLGVPPIMGRLISPSDDVHGASQVLDISYGVWQSVYGADPNVVGRETLFNGQKATIIGVMPQGFEFPPGELDPPVIWNALQIDPVSPGGRGSHFLYLLGRLKPGVTAGAAQAELASLVNYYGEHAAPKTHTFSPLNVTTRTPHTIVSYPLQAEVVSSVRPALLMLLGAVAFVLLIACVNVANLLIARAEARRREIAIRGALGAGLWRLARQFATEGVVMSLTGAILGLGLAFGGLRLIQLTNAGALPRAMEIGIDWRVLLFTLGISIATGV